MKSIPILEMKQVFSGGEESILGPAQSKFSFPNKSKIKVKILANFSVASQND